jgi:hypothetical protein
MIIADQLLSRGWLNIPPVGLGELSDELIAGLLDHAPRREWPAERASPELWQRLRTEDSLLRVVEEGRLRSVAPTYFDEILLQHTPAEWCWWARVVGNTMVDAGERGHNIGDAFLIWRLRELVKEGKIECEGELPGREHAPENRATARLRRLD